LLALAGCDLWPSATCDGAGQTNIRQQSSPTTRDLLAVSGWESRQHVAVGEGGTIVAETDTGWVELESPTTLTLHGVTVGPADAEGTFAIAVVGEQGAIYHAERKPGEPLTWSTPETSGATFWDVHTDGTRWLAVGDGVIASSNDGLIWSEQPLSEPAKLRAVSGWADNFWAVGDAGAAFSSTDGGVTWIRAELGVEVDLTGVSLIGGGVRIVGDQGLVLVRPLDASSFVHEDIDATRLGGVYGTMAIDDGGALIDLDVGEVQYQGQATLLAIDEYVAVGEAGTIVKIEESFEGVCG
jgi:photosystem II stability/assembly factor-like uncharacterized protein